MVDYIKLGRKELLECHGSSWLWDHFATCVPFHTPVIVGTDTNPGTWTI